MAFGQLWKKHFDHLFSSNTQLRVKVIHSNVTSVKGAYKGIVTQCIQSVCCKVIIIQNSPCHCVIFFYHC